MSQRHLSCNFVGWLVGNIHSSHTQSSPSPACLTTSFFCFCQSRNLRQSLSHVVNKPEKERQPCNTCQAGLTTFGQILSVERHTEDTVRKSCQDDTSVRMIERLRLQKNWLFPNKLSKTDMARHVLFVLLSICLFFLSHVKSEEWVPLIYRGWILISHSIQLFIVTHSHGEFLDKRIIF